MGSNNYELYDNTRLNDFKKCPRFFFFRHRMHWVSERESRLPLIFGGAWHAGMDVMWSGIKYGEARSDVIAGSMKAFKDHWVEAGMSLEIDMELGKYLAPRTPAVANEMYYAYYDERHKQIAQWDLLATERAFAVPIRADNESLFYIGRIDKIVAPDSRSIRGIEHKTTTLTKIGYGKEPKIRPLWAEQWSPNSQVDGYNFSLRMLYPGKDVDIWIDGALVNQKGEHFQWVPVSRQLGQIDAWLWEVNDWIDAVRLEDAKLAEASPSDPYLAAFRKETSKCIDFNAVCPFIDLCKARANPLTWGAEPPSGFVKKVWNPLDHIGTPEELKV